VSNPVILVDDHPLIVSALADALRTRGLDVEAVSPTTNDMISHLSNARLVVLDLELGQGRSGEQLLPELTARNIPTVILTGETDEVRYGRCLQLGALDVISKGLSLDEIATKLYDCVEHGQGASGARRDRLVTIAEEYARRERGIHDLFAELTPGEQAVLLLLTEGRSAREISTERVTSIATTRTHIRSILHKLGVNSQIAAISFALNHGIQERLAAPGKSVESGNASINGTVSPVV
jgi:two-component system nitrate/nitrite response regulator NarL